MHFIMAIENDTLASNELEGFFMGLRQRVVITKFTQTVKEYVKSSNPDIILMSLTFRDKKELEFVIELRRDVITAGIPILALIPKEDENFVFNHKVLGFTDYMVKPLEKTLLLERIHSLVEDHKFNETSKTRDNISFVVIDRNVGRVIFQCRANLKRFVFPEFRKIFTPNFLKSVNNEYVCFDIRGVPEVGKEEVEVFERISKIFATKDKIHVIAGRHMGAFVEHGTDDDRFQVFMAPNEFDEFMKMEDQRQEELRKKDKKDKHEKGPTPPPASAAPTPTAPAEENKEAPPTAETTQEAPPQAPTPIAIHTETNEEGKT